MADFDEVLKDKTMQAEFDRRVAKALETAKAKWDAEAEKQREELERQAGMSAQEKAEHEYAQREQELIAREAAIGRREMRAMAMDWLSQHELPVELAGAVDLSDKESCMEGLDAVERVFRMAVQSGVEARMRGRVPEIGAKNDRDDVPRDDETYYETYYQRKV